MGFPQTKRRLYIRMNGNVSCVIRMDSELRGRRATMIYVVSIISMVEFRSVVLVRFHSRGISPDSEVNHLHPLKSILSRTNLGLLDLSKPLLLLIVKTLD